MKIGSIHIVVTLCLVGAALLTPLPSAKSLQIRRAMEDTKSSCIGTVAMPLHSIAHDAQFDPAVISYKKGVAPCAGEERNSTADDERAVEVERRIIPPLILWIIAKTRWDAQAAPPVRFIPHAELVRMFTGGTSNSVTIHAAYSDDNHTIYLPEGWKPGSLLDRSALLHELVHHLQYLNGVPATCPAEYEWKAYELQVAWLRAQGVDDPLEIMGMSARDVYILSRCPEF